MPSIPCFWLEPTDQVAIRLRRYAGSTADAHCPGRLGYHSTEVEIARRTRADGDCSKVYRVPPGIDPDDPALVPSSDPRWPTACACGRVYVDGDYWQHHIARLYRRGDTGELISLDDAPAGAMWDAPWYADTGRPVGPDGRTLVVRTPGGDWIVDHPPGSAPTGAPWSRTGDPSVQGQVTANPSILIGGAEPRYHGWLRDGVLVEC